MARRITSGVPKPSSQVLGEFRAFLREYKIVALALAFIMGGASNTLVSSLVENIIMPFLDPLIVEETWQQAVLTVGPISLRWGAFLADLLNFMLLAFVVFFIAKKLLRDENAVKGPAKP